LAKWVHWEGGNEPAEKAWPKPWIARFTHWTSDPPDFGRPVHPSTIVGEAPKLYVFHAPIQATYVPYYDPPYWYEGYRHVVRWRFQVVALAKSLGDLALVLLKQPLFLLLALLFGLALVGYPARRRELWHGVRSAWPVGVPAVLMLALFLPVHLEGRYLSAGLAVLGMLALVSLAGLRSRAGFSLFLLVFAGGLLRSQGDVWLRARNHWTPAANVEWRVGDAVRASGIAPGTEVGMISWDPNLQCDWAYMAGVRITSEIATGADEAAFWALPPAGQAEVLARFHAAGAQAVLTWDKPRGAAVGWQRLGAVPMWMYRF
jgi:hypothetical protein